MKWLVIGMAALLCACPRGTTSNSVALDHEISVAYGEEVLVEDENLRIRFAELNADSRCPTGAQCVWAGEATITVQISKPDRLETSAMLTIPSDNRSSVAYHEYVITLLALEPYPSVDHTPTPEEYTATIGITKR